jgi:hypothetical protein
VGGWPRRCGAPQGRGSQARGVPQGGAQGWGSGPTVLGVELGVGWCSNCTQAEARGGVWVGPQGGARRCSGVELGWQRRVVLKRSAGGGSRQRTVELGRQHWVVLKPERRWRLGGNTRAGRRWRNGAREDNGERGNERCQQKREMVGSTIFLAIWFGSERNTPF